MIKVCYSELDGPKGLSLRLEAAGHAGYAPAGQDIVCAGASTLMQALVYTCWQGRKTPAAMHGTSRKARALLWQRRHR